MRQKLQLNRTLESEPEFYYTTLFVVTEWERLTGRHVGLLGNPMYSDLACWLHTILKLKGEKIPDNWRDWVKENPEMDMRVAGDETNPNPTDAAPTAAS